MVCGRAVAVFVFLGLCGLSPAGAALTQAQLRTMLTTLYRKGGFTTFNNFFNILISPKGGLLPQLTNPTFTDKITIFAPTDAAFAAAPTFAYKFHDPRCSNARMPNGCIYPIITFHMARGKTTYNLATLMKAKAGFQMGTVEGSTLQTFASKGPHGFFVGPALGPPPFGASKVSGSFITKPNAYVGPTIVVHGIGRLMAVPILFPNGF